MNHKITVTCAVCKEQKESLAILLHGQHCCEACYLRVMGLFFSWVPRVNVRKCPLGHDVTPDLVLGEPDNSPRVGWIVCDVCSEAELAATPAAPVVVEDEFVNVEIPKVPKNHRGGRGGRALPRKTRRPVQLAFAVQ